jgi:hypothetical protein
VTGERVAMPTAEGTAWRELRSPWGEEMAIARIERVD